MGSIPTSSTISGHRVVMKDLIHQARLQIRRDRDAPNVDDNGAIRTLRDLVTDDVLQEMLLFLKSPIVVDRHVAAVVLMQWGLPDAEGNDLIVEAARTALDAERDKEVLSALLWTLGYQQKDTDVLDTLFLFAFHGAPEVRKAVVDNLLRLVDGPLPKSVHDVLLALAVDNDSDVRWAVAWELAKGPSRFVDDKRWVAVSHLLAKDDDRDIRRFATTAHFTLLDMSLDDILQDAKAEVVADRATDDIVDNFATVYLCELDPSLELRKKLLQLLSSSSCVERDLAARVMRRTLTINPTEDSAVFVEALSVAVVEESDPTTRRSMLSALACQKLPLARPALLSLADHDDEWTRHRVANDLLCTLEDNSAPVPDDVNEAFLTFAEDENGDTRWSVFYDVAEYPELFAHAADRWMAAATEALDDVDDEVRQVARRALDALRAVKSE